MPLILPPAHAVRLRALAVTSANRIAQLPTVQESGMPDFEVTAWYGIWAPAGTPVPILDKLLVDITSVLRNPEPQQRFKDMVDDI